MEARAGHHQALAEVIVRVASAESRAEQAESRAIQAESRAAQADLRTTESESKATSPALRLAELQRHLSGKCVLCTDRHLPCSKYQLRFRMKRWPPKVWKTKEECRAMVMDKEGDTPVTKEYEEI